MTEHDTNQGTRQRRLRGTVVSDRMDKTVRVRVTRLKVNPKYRKRYKVSQSFMAHDPENAYHVGDVVIIQADRPRSKTKRWSVVERISAGAAAPEGGADTDVEPETE
jgi:small subunit ribosomal protein S17